MLNINKLKLKTVIYSAFAITLLSSINTPTVFAASTEQTEEIVPKTFEDIVGRPQTEEEANGDPAHLSVTRQGVPLGENVGTITVKADVPWNIHEQAYVTLTNMNTGAEYATFLEEANRFESSINVPAGVYVTGGGLSNDGRGHFKMDEIYFNVEPYANTSISVTLNDCTEELKEGEKQEEELAEAAKAKSSENAKETSEEEKTKTGIAKLFNPSETVETLESNAYHGSKSDTIDFLKTIGMSVVFLGIGFFAYKKYEKKHLADDDE